MNGKNEEARVQTSQEKLKKILKEIPNWKYLYRKIKGNEASNYQPITCLPLTWKLLTGIIADEIYGFLENEGILPEENKGCRRKSKGTGHQLYIAKMHLEEVK